MSEAQQNRIADLVLKHLQGILTSVERDELQNILFTSKSARASFETLSDPARLADLIAKRNDENQKDREKIKEWIIGQIEANAE